MPRAVLASTVTAVCLFAGFARGAFYEFTIEGELVYALLGDVAVGSPVTIRYVADSRDQNPDPAGGAYAASGATIDFPNLTLATPTSSTDIFVSLNGTAAELVHYVHSGPFYGLSVAFRFPDGTIESDALPLTLPLDNANIKQRCGNRDSFAVRKSGQLGTALKWGRNRPGGDWRWRRWRRSPRAAG